MNELERLLIMMKQLQELFQINHFNISLSFVIGGDVEASTYVLYNCNAADIRIKESLSFEEKKKSLIHELIHIIKRNSQQIAEDNIKIEEVKLIWSREMEREQEMLANGIYKLIEKQNS